MNALSIAAISIGAIVAAVLVFSWLLARQWCRPRRKLPSRTPADYALPFEPVEFRSHGVQISGWFVPGLSGAPPYPAVVLTHGWSANATEMLPLARLLHRAGFAALLYDTRGHGSSGEDGPITIVKFAEDIVASIDYLTTRSDVDPRRLAVVGRSIGASSAILATSGEPRIRAAVSCSAFADPEALTRDYLVERRLPSWPFAWLVCRFVERWLGTTIKRIAPQNRVGHIGVPLLLVHGESDRYILPNNIEVLYARAPQERTQRLLLPNRGHSDLTRDPECGRAIVAFLEENL
jgi:alpha-beta hydrolase superfamily lysophospholipase